MVGDYAELQRVDANQPAEITAGKEAGNRLFCGDDFVS